MALSKRVTVQDTTTLIYRHERSDFGAAHLVVKNPAEGKTVDLGNAEVVTDEGFELAAGQDVRITLEPGEPLFGVCAGEQSQAIQVLVGGTS